jgi:hypothetical protein
VPADTSVSREGEAGFAPELEADEPIEADEHDPLAKEFAEIDAVLARSSNVLSGAEIAPAKQPWSEEWPDLVYDPDWDEGARLAEWQAVAAETRRLPPVLRAAVLLDAWHEIEVLQRGAWLGPLLVAALLRQEGLAAHHVAALHLGARNIPREQRRAKNRGDRLLAFLHGIQEAARVGLREHDRLMLAKDQMERRLRLRRASSKLPHLVDLVLARPLVSTRMIQQALRVSKQGALNLVGELSLREMTGRGRYRAWAIL